MKQILLLACIALGMNTCYSRKGDVTDPVKFSKAKLFFSAQGGLDTTISQSAHYHWWIMNAMSIDGKYYDFKNETDTSRFPCGFKTENGEDVRVTKPDPIDGNEIGKIEGSWFTIDKATKQMLIFTITPNETGKPRELTLDIDEGNYGTNITVTQTVE
jgi:hypothetical protein